MARRASRPLNRSAARGADDDLYRRHESDKRPNALFDAEGKRRPLDSRDPSQARLREEWLDLYVAHGGRVESNPRNPTPPARPVARCPRASATRREPSGNPLRANLHVRLVHPCDRGPLNGGTVRISGLESRETHTGPDGWARFENIARGTYDIEAVAPRHERGTRRENAPAATSTVVEMPLQSTLRVRPAQTAYTVVLDNLGNVPGGFPILELRVTDGPPNHLFDVQVCRAGSAVLTGGPGIGGSWVQTDPRDARVHRASFSSWSNRERTLRLDGSGAATYRMPLEWWRDQARQPLSAFTEKRYSFRVAAFRDASTPVCALSAIGTVTVRNNLTRFRVVDLGYVSGGMDKYIRMEFTVREADTTNMYTFVQWKRGGREQWSGTPPVMRRPNVRDYNVTHVSDYPVWQIDRVGTNPRYWDGAYDVSADKKTASATDQPSGVLDPGDSHGFTHIDFDTKVHLNFEVPATVTVTRRDGSPPVYGVVVGVLANPQPVLLASGGWNTRVLATRQPDGSRVITRPATFAGPGP